MNRRQFVGRTGAVAALTALGSELQMPAAAQTANPSGPDKGNLITRITATAVSVPCQYQVGSYQRNIRMAGTVAEVETAGGLTGHGFSSITNDEIVVSAIRDVIAPYLKGKDAFAREAISEELFWRLTPRGQTGHAVHAISAIDCALWDIAGKKYGEPIWRLLGGARREVRVYTTCGMNFLNRDELAQVARDIRKTGQPRLKMVVAAGADQLDTGGKSVEDILAEDIVRVRTMREAAGGADAEVFIDANQSLDEFQARHFVRQIAGLRYRLL